MKNHPEKYLVIHPVEGPEQKLLYRVRSKSSLPIQKVKVNVFSSKQLIETFYIQDLKSQGILEVPAKLPFSKKGSKTFV